MMTELAWMTLACSLLTTACFLSNFRQFRKSSRKLPDEPLPPVSVLIPARDEEQGIRETVRRVLDSQHVTLEILILDDQSQDRTIEIVEELAADPRVRLIRGNPLPAGWCGKQYACHQLAEHAAYDEFVFIDADVHLTAEAISRSVAQRQQTQVDLLSGFPRQIVGTLGEALLIPMIHIVLLTYLPFRAMRSSKRPTASAGCGQLFVTARAAYMLSGGHQAIRTSMHDGVMLPRAYRLAGLSTDLFDASDLASCRMYEGFRATCLGLLKNAHEGIANARLIVPATTLISLGYLLPTCLFTYLLATMQFDRNLVLSATTVVGSLLPRWITAAKFDRAWCAVPLFPLSIVLFLMIQWIAFSRTLFGGHSSWRGRSYSSKTA